jgi:carboxyl-terminal processing protease
VGADTSYSSIYLRKLAGKNVLNTFVLEYMDRNRANLKDQYKTFDDYHKNFSFTPEDIKTFIAKGESEGIKFDEAQFNISKDEILRILKGLVASNVWQISEYYQIINENDKVIDKALKVISDSRDYNTLLGYK